MPYLFWNQLPLDEGRGRVGLGILDFGFWITLLLPLLLPLFLFQESFLLIIQPQMVLCLLVSADIDASFLIGRSKYFGFL